MFYVLYVIAKNKVGISSGDWIAIGVAIISLFGVIVSTGITNKTTKKINKSNEELQKELCKKSIDASLTASARIEWIQKVRNVTAELISLYFQILNSENIEEILNMLFKAQEKTELLILYFGPTEQNNCKENSIDSLESNENKNDLIIEFLSNLSIKFNRYYKILKNNELENLKRIREQRLALIQDHVIDYEMDEYVDDEGNIINVRNPICDDEYNKSLVDIDKKIEDLVNFSKSLNESLVMLRNIIRIYLKIEWNKAKKGE